MVERNINKITYVVVITALILFSILLLKYNFCMPEYYLNKDTAWEFLNKYPNTTVVQVNDQFKNPQYEFHNGVFHIFSISGILVVLCLGIKWKICENFVIKNIFINKFFVYFLWNILYIIFAHFSVITLIADLEKYVYPSSADSFGIPELMISAFFYFAGFIYYPIINILTFIVYNTRITNKFLIILYKLFFAMLMLYMIVNIFSQFSWYYVVLYFIYTFYFLLIVDAIKHLGNKKFNSYFIDEVVHCTK